VACAEISCAVVNRSTEDMASQEVLGRPRKGQGVFRRLPFPSLRLASREPSLSLGRNWRPNARRVSGERVRIGHIYRDECLT
jgi:hypothetical protein